VKARGTIVLWGLLRYTDFALVHSFDCLDDLEQKSALAISVITQIPIRLRKGEDEGL
jgi:hypothetical protein